jgi:hypothetical protein
MSQPNILQDASKLIQFCNSTNSLYNQLTAQLCSMPLAACESVEFYSLNFYQEAFGGNFADPPLHNATVFFEYFKTSVPVVKTAVLVGQYLCQIPILKPAGSLFVSILIADLVLLQALWQLVKLVATLLLERWQPDSRHCVGCANKRPNEGYELVSTQPSRGDGDDAVDSEKSGVKVTSLGG